MVQKSTSLFRRHIHSAENQISDFQKSCPKAVIDSSPLNALPKISSVFTVDISKGMLHASKGEVKKRLSVIREYVKENGLDSTGTGSYRFWIGILIGIIGILLTIIGLIPLWNSAFNQDRVVGNQSNTSENIDSVDNGAKEKLESRPIDTIQ